MLAPSGNGKPITLYTARCTSTNGGAKRGAASIGGQVVVTNMSLGASYTCTVTATNARGAGAGRQGRTDHDLELAGPGGVGFVCDGSGPRSPRR